MHFLIYSLDGGKAQLQAPDELKLTRGEVILLLCKDEEARWFGRLQNGQQGYVPALHIGDLSHQVSG